MFAPNHLVMPRVRRVQRVFLSGLVDKVFDERARKAQAIVLIDRTTAGQSVMQNLGDRITDADVFEDVERRDVNPLDVGIGQWPVLAATLARPDGTGFDTTGSRGSARRSTSPRLCTPDMNRLIICIPSSNPAVIAAV